MKRAFLLLMAVVMLLSVMSLHAFADGNETVTITEDTVWNDGDVIGNVTIKGDVTITVNGTVTVAGTIRMGTDAIHTVTIKGGTEGAKLIRRNDFTGQMFYVEGTTYTFQTLNLEDLILDGGAVWTGDVDATLNRGTVNSGVKATGSVLYLVRANATLDNCTLQNHDNGTNGKASAVFLREYATITFDSSVARNNNNADSYYKGGVVSTRYGGTVIANNSEVYGNSATHGGFVGVGASGSYSVKVDCVDTKIYNNYASTGGAAFYLQDNGSRSYQTNGDTQPGYLKLDGCTLENNASPDGLIHSYVYYTPAWINDTTIANNNCAIYTYGSGENRSFSVSGNTTITTNYDGILYEAPVRIYGQLGDSASIPMNEATVKHLMEKYGYLVTATPEIDHQYNHTGKKQSSVVPYEYMGISVWNLMQTDLAKIKLYEGCEYTNWILTDYDGNGAMDAVPTTVADSTVEIYLDDDFNGKSLRYASDVSTVIANVPVCTYGIDHPGYYFNGWIKVSDGTLIRDTTNRTNALQNGDVLTATFAVARPRITISASAPSVMEGNSITLTATINNQDTNGFLTYTYQWYKNSTAIEGATSSTYTVTEADAGYYSYQCKITATDPNYNSETDHAIKTVYGTNSAVESIVLQFTEVPPVAKIVETGVEYKTLTEAVAAANELGTATIEMLADIDFDSTAALSVTGNVTIKGEYTISRGNYTGTLFTVTSGASLTLDGGLTIDGNNNYAFDLESFQQDMANWNTPVPTADSTKWFTPEEGAPVATGYMITTTGGTVNLNEVTIQNNYSTGSGIVNAGADSTVTLTGAKITHVAATNGNGVIANISGSGINVTVNEGTVIDGNHVGGNHGLFKVYSGATLTMNGGEIKNTTGWNSNGTVVGVYWGTFNMNGGTICSNLGVYGPSNGRNAAIYLHSGHTFTMTGGTICCNSGRSRGGVDAPYSNGTATISGGLLLDNVSRGNADTYDVLGTSGMQITGGIYTQNVNQWCAPGYVCLPFDRDLSAYVDLSYAPEGYDHNTRDNDYIVLPGYLVSYYLVETNGEETTETLVKEEILLIPAGKNASDVDLFATPYFHLNSDESQIIKTWYTDKEMTQQFAYSQEITENIKLYGATYEDLDLVTVIVDNKTMVQGDTVPGFTYTVDFGNLTDGVVNVDVSFEAITDPTVGEHTITATATLTDGTGEAKYYAVKVVNGTLTVNRRTYSIQYNAGEGLYTGSEANNGENALTENGYGYNEQITLRGGDGFSREGYTLVGWTINGKTYALGAEVNENLTDVHGGTVQATAIWEENETTTPGDEGDDETGNEGGEGGDEILGDDDVPLGPGDLNTPQTSDTNTLVGAILGAVASLALAALVLLKKKSFLN